MKRAKRTIPTEFERRVYAVVRRIPPGEVRSYRWVAERLGDPNLARAVGQALNRNPWPHHLAVRQRRRPQRGRRSERRRQVVGWPDRVPCHRVIRTDGSLGGYAWGVARKRRLLFAERQRAATSSPLTQLVPIRHNSE